MTQLLTPEEQAKFDTAWDAAMVLETINSKPRLTKLDQKRLRAANHSITPANARPDTSRHQPVDVRRAWVGTAEPLPLTRQCELTGVARSGVYAPRLAATPDATDVTLLELIDAEYTRRPFYGSRKLMHYLRGLGHSINRKRVQRLMRVLGLAGMAPGPNTSRPRPQHKVYPYLLRGVTIDRPNQVWSTDITYIRLARGFVYLVAVIDWYSRKVLSWCLSNTLDSGFCVACLEQAVQTYEAPEIFNTDQGCQFTSTAFTGALKTHGIMISMDGRGRALDNIFVEGCGAASNTRTCI